MEVTVIYSRVKNFIKSLSGDNNWKQFGPRSDCMFVQMSGVPVKPV